MGVLGGIAWSREILNLIVLVTTLINTETILKLLGLILGIGLVFFALYIVSLESFTWRGIEHSRSGIGYWLHFLGVLFNGIALIYYTQRKKNT